MQETLEFVFEIIDPMIHDFWGLYAVDCVEDPDAHDYIFETLLKLNISFLIPDHYKERVEHDRANLEDLDKVITFIKDFIDDSELIRQVDKSKVIREIQENFKFSESKAKAIYYNAYSIVSRNDESYRKWRITPL